MYISLFIYRINLVKLYLHLLLYLLVTILFTLVLLLLKFQLHVASASDVGDKFRLSLCVNKLLYLNILLKILDIMTFPFLMPKKMRFNQEHGQKEKNKTDTYQIESRFDFADPENV